MRPITCLLDGTELQEMVSIIALIVENKKGLPIQYRPFKHCAALLHECRKKAFEKNPLLQGGLIVACVRKSYRVGFSDPSRPDFPEYGYRFFQIQAFLTSTAGVSPQLSLYQNQKQLSTKYKKFQTIIKNSKFSLFRFSTRRAVFL